MQIIGGNVRNVTVAGTGHVDVNGTLILDQTVQQGAEPATRRGWQIREPSPGSYAGSLSDAAGPVVGSASGNRLRLQYRMKGGLSTDQRLTLQEGGREADNVLVIRKSELRIAALYETIRNLD